MTRHPDYYFLYGMMTATGLSALLWWVAKGAGYSTSMAWTGPTSACITLAIITGFRHRRFRASQGR